VAYTKKPLAKLQQVDLRDVWGHEAQGFTNWLAQEENLTLLSEGIGVSITPLETEANVGPFKVDILAEEEGTGRKIIIENQLEFTNHDHLGKIITYASGYDAEVIVWIARDVREEHKRAVEWLNGHTEEKIGFFLIKVELWQIEGSSPAPKFVVVASPNEWAKTIKAGPPGGELTQTKLQQLDFWTKFKEYAQNKKSGIHFGHSPRPQHWYNVSIGSSDAHIALTIDSRKNSLGCEIYIDKSKELFKYLQERKDEIESDIGDKVEWVDAPVASRAVVKKVVGSVFAPSETLHHFEWLYEKTVLFQKVFGKYLKAYKESPVP
jgi:hypothetical protein